MIKKSSLLIIVALYALPNTTIAGSKTLMTEIKDNVKDVCQAPSNKGKYWDVTVKGSGEAKVKLKLVSDANLSGGAVFKRGEWEGVQQGLQAAENADYRSCVKKLTPIFIDKFVPTKKYRNIKDTESFLLPANDPMPSSYCTSHDNDGNSLRVYLGSNMAYANKFPAGIIELAGESVLSINRSSKGISVSCLLRSDDGRVVVGLKNNKILINSNNYWYSERPDKHTLIVYDQKGNTTLNVRYLNKNAIKIAGTFHYSNPPHAPVVINEERITLPNNTRLSNNCSGNAGISAFAF